MAQGERGLRGEALERWYRRSVAEIEDERRQALKAGRQAWDEATRTGERVVARTQAELEALGRSELARRAAAAGLQVDAVGRAAANRMTFGAADNFSAAADATFGKGEGDSFGARYRSNLAKEQGRTSYDALNRPVAKAAGDFAGDALAFKGAGGSGASVVRRLPPKAKGLVGEVLSAGKSTLLRDAPVRFQFRQELSAGGHTVADHLTKSGRYVEAKFGPTARLSPQQRKAQVQFGNRYRVDRWHPYHVGRITGAAGAATVGLHDDDLGW